MKFPIFNVESSTYGFMQQQCYRKLCQARLFVQSIFTVCEYTKYKLSDEEHWLSEYEPASCEDAKQLF